MTLSHLPSSSFCLTMPITSCCDTILFFDWHRKIHLQSPAHSSGTGIPCTLCDACFVTAASLHRHYLDGYHLPTVQLLRSTTFLQPQSETGEKQTYCLPCCRAFQTGNGHSAHTRLLWHNAIHHVLSLTRSPTSLRPPRTSGLSTWLTPPPTPQSVIKPPPTPAPMYTSTPTPISVPPYSPAPAPTLRSPSCANPRVLEPRC